MLFWSFICPSLNFWCLCSRMVTWSIYTVSFDTDCSICTRAGVSCNLKYYRIARMYELTYILSVFSFAQKSLGSYCYHSQPYTNQVQEDLFHAVDNYVHQAHDLQPYQTLPCQHQTQILPNVLFSNCLQMKQDTSVEMTTPTYTNMEAVSISALFMEIVQVWLIQKSF